MMNIYKKAIFILSAALLSASMAVSVQTLPGVGSEEFAAEEADYYTISAASDLKLYLQSGDVFTRHIGEYNDYRYVITHYHDRGFIRNRIEFETLLAPREMLFTSEDGNFSAYVSAMKHLQPGWQPP